MAEQILENSEKFFRLHPSPTTNNLLKSVSSQDEILADAKSTRILITPKTLVLIKEFLSLQTHEIYKSMSVDGFLKRLILKRPLTFFGPNDTTITRSYERFSNDDWNLVGTEFEKSHLSINEYLTYDEMCISALIGVSSHARFINSGSRNNLGMPAAKGTFVARAVVVGLVGCRFERLERMESLFCLVGSYRVEKKLEGMWKRFYGIEKFPELQDLQANDCRFERIRGKSVYLNKALYKTRIKVTAELFINEAIKRGKQSNRPVFANTVGLGLGVWKVHECQNFLFAKAFVEVLSEAVVDYSFVLNFSYISLSPSQQKEIAELSKAKILFLDRDLAELLPPEYSNHLLITSYAWDSNSFPGNEIYAGSLAGSGDPAANCCCTIFELHNPYINPYCDASVAE